MSAFLPPSASRPSSSGGTSADNPGDWRTAVSCPAAIEFEGKTTYVHADLRDPDGILASVGLRETLDLGRLVPR